MPGGDKTGPLGMGPMTGRGTGFCAGFAAPGYRNPGGAFGMGSGRGRGGRRMCNFTGFPGWARLGYSTYGGACAPVVGEKELLTNRAEFLEDQLQQVKKRLKVLNQDAD